MWIIYIGMDDIENLEPKELLYKWMSDIGFKKQPNGIWKYQDETSYCFATFEQLQNAYKRQLNTPEIGTNPL